MKLIWIEQDINALDVFIDHIQAEYPIELDTETKAASW